MQLDTPQLPTALRSRTRWGRLGPSRIPAMLVHPNGHAEAPPPAVIWIHGRTAHKEMDPGRYLRLMRAGIAVCAVDLPGHGERLDPELQRADRSLEVVLQMTAEIDEVLDALRERQEFDADRLGIGGMSAGGMAVLSRLCREHPFLCTSLEATSGSWAHQRHREMFQGVEWQRVSPHDPIAQLEGWREIPVQAFHSRLDQYVSFAGQQEFVERLRERYERPELIDFVTFDRTGAPGEHVGFGRLSAETKNRQRDFFREHLV
jgi:dienelactone hydrolase